MEISPWLIKELSWWQTNVDASPSGWGVFCEGKGFHGFWNEKDSQSHINFLEIKAAYYAIKSLTKNKNNMNILLRIDNQTAISCINKAGSVRFPHLHEITRALWQWCENKNILVFASYIKSSKNLADKESRSLSVDTEYQLNSYAFSSIIQNFGNPEIDLFASKLNRKCEKYTSWFPDPNSFSIDAFTISWNAFYFYAFPPFACIARVLDKIIQEKASGIVVVPNWPAQPWYPDNASPLQEPFPGGRKIIWLSFLNKGLPESAIPTMINSLTEGTLNQYEGCFRKYWSFCHQKQHQDPFVYNLAIYLEFLEQMFDNGLSYSVINTYRSAMNLIFAPSEEDRKNINRFLKGVAKMRPPHPKYKFTWNPDPVLSFVKNWYPLNRLNIENLTYKLVFLMAITSASRTQTLSKIKITDIIKLERKIEIRVTERIKTSASNKFQPLLIFPYFREAPELCVAHTIETYLERTSQYRKDHEYLILTHKKPIHPATSQTISRWLKRVLKLGGVDTTVFSSHSIRHASTSAASRKGINIDIIRDTAGWTPASNTFFEFYNRPLSEPREKFAETILNIGRE
ncbi:hypothetical protein NQ315_005640 [Exocentrus adspersus]|uniref:Tyr recombinase domain-containing protein n=1 Tax=Exocentrus adspersus TaxID=1586481 RepID=A0AAV8V7H7_9CUCU|nr:hypothetical protein NQ315_005640 [Exocentrus adspersus]